MAGAISKILFILGSYNFLAYPECVRSYAWSKDHSDQDLSSVPGCRNGEFSGAAAAWSVLAILCSIVAQFGARTQC